MGVRFFMKLSWKSLKLFGTQSFNIWKSWNLIGLFCSAEARIFPEFFFERKSFSRISNLLLEFNKFSFSLILISSHFKLIISILEELNINSGIVLKFRLGLIILIKYSRIASSSWSGFHVWFAGYLGYFEFK